MEKVFGSSKYFNLEVDVVQGIGTSLSRNSSQLEHL